jgi:hypothetical protein
MAPIYNKSLMVRMHFQIFLPVVHIAFVQQKQQQGNRLLRAAGVDFEHVQVANTDHELFASRGTVNASGSLVDTRFQIALDVR